MVIFGEGRTDLVDFAVSLQARNDEPAPGGRRDRRRADAHRQANRRDGRERRGRSLRRFGDRGGQQSATVALLDASRSGVIISSVQGRDYARIYTKELDCGSSAVALSPEEEEAVRRAMAR